MDKIGENWSIMNADKMICMRCNGRKQMYRFGSGYTHSNNGGRLVDCPMCLGEGKIKTIEAATKEVEIKIRKKRESKSKPEI